MGAIRRPVQLGQIVGYVLLVLAALLYLMPIYVQVVTGLKSFKDVSLAHMWTLPASFNLESFAQAYRHILVRVMRVDLKVAFRFYSQIK